MELEERVTEGVYSLAASCLLESNLKVHKASDLACAILFAVRRSLGVEPVWSAEMTALTHESPYSEPVMEALTAMETELAGRNEFFSSSSLVLDTLDGDAADRDGEEDQESQPHTPVAVRRTSLGAEDVVVGDDSTISVAVNVHGVLSTPGCVDKENVGKGAKKETSPFSVAQMDDLEVADV
jgi:hypothetical protein